MATILSHLRCVKTNQLERHIKLWQQRVGVRRYTLVRLVTEEIYYGGVLSNSHRQNIAHDSLWIAWPGIDLKHMGDMAMILKSSISKHILRIKCMSCSGFSLRWMPQGTSRVKSTLIRVIVWCRQATNHYLSHCWPGSISPYGATRPRWVKAL